MIFLLAVLLGILVQVLQLWLLKLVLRGAKLILRIGVLALKLVLWVLPIWLLARLSLLGAVCFVAAASVLALCYGLKRFGKGGGTGA